MTFNPQDFLMDCPACKIAAGIVKNLNSEICRVEKEPVRFYFTSSGKEIRINSIEIKCSRCNNSEKVLTPVAAELISALAQYLPGAEIPGVEHKIEGGGKSATVRFVAPESAVS